MAPENLFCLIAKIILTYFVLHSVQVYLPKEILKLHNNKIVPEHIIYKHLLSIIKWSAILCHCNNPFPDPYFCIGYFYIFYIRYIKIFLVYYVHIRQIHLV